MRSRLTRFTLVVSAVLLVVAHAPPAACAPVSQAERLYQHALQMLERNDIDSRRVAIAELEQATLLAPRNPDYQLLLARTYYRAGYLKNARGRFEKVVRMMPKDAVGRFGLGQVWRRDWLKYLERASLDRAVDHFSTSARLDPGNADAWIALVPLLVEQDDLRAAAAAASRALEADSRRAEALLAVAYTSYKLGRVERADSAFRATYPKLPRNVREKLDDISPVATEQDTLLLNHLPGSKQAEFVRRFWKANDPDLATPENEAQLEYWSRVAHAFFLFYDPKRREWDERGEVYVRYGAPQKIEYNPVTLSLNGWGGGPRNVLVWSYTDLGMRVVMEDRILSEYYLLPIAMDHDPDPVPDPDSLARRGEAFAASGGRGVFRKLPPGVEPMPIEGAVARFETPAGIRLLAQVETPGTPADTLAAEWVVLDSLRREVTRGTQTLTTSDCDVGDRRVADFAVQVPPGPYEVGVTVRDPKGRRGIYRRHVDVGAASAALALSDVVVSCGLPSTALATPQAVRLGPNPAARVEGNDPLTAYFEIYHLSPGADGESRFEYVYVVKSATKDPRIWLQRVLNPRKQPNPIEVSREEQNVGALRRQFITVPVQGLPGGRYKLEIRVRDLIAGAEAVKSVEFVKVGTGG